MSALGGKNGSALDNRDHSGDFVGFGLGHLIYLGWICAHPVGARHHRGAHPRNSRTTSGIGSRAAATVAAPQASYGAASSCLATSTTIGRRSSSPWPLARTSP